MAETKQVPSNLSTVLGREVGIDPERILWKKVCRRRDGGVGRLMFLIHGERQVQLIQDLWRALYVRGLWMSSVCWSSTGDREGWDRRPKYDHEVVASGDYRGAVPAEPKGKVG